MIIDVPDSDVLLGKIEEVARDWASSLPHDRAGLMSETAMELVAELLGVDTNGKRAVVFEEQPSDDDAPGGCP